MSWYLFSFDNRLKSNTSYFQFCNFVIFKYSSVTTVIIFFIEEIIIIVFIALFWYVTVFGGVRFVYFINF